MRSIRISAATGAVSLRDTGAVEQLELQLADPVALRIDRAALLDPRRFGAPGGRGHDFGAQPAAIICTPPSTTSPAPGAVALELLPDNRPQPKREEPGGP